MPPTVISPSNLLSGPPYNQDIVLDSPETQTQSALQWFYMPMGQSNDVPIQVSFFLIGKIIILKNYNLANKISVCVESISNSTNVSI